jgi:hypothetical protein
MGESSDAIATNHLRCGRHWEGRMYIQVRMVVEALYIASTIAVVAALTGAIVNRSRLLWWRCCAWPLHGGCALLATSAFNSLSIELTNQTSPAVLAVRAAPCRWRRASGISLERRRAFNQASGQRAVFLLFRIAVGT